MFVNELRIGNYIDMLGTTLKIEASHIASIHEMEQIGSSLFKETFGPIPLTKDRLLKFGFKNIDGTIRIDIGSIQIGILSEGNRFYIQIGTSSVTIHVKHIHQLQNLYFALTGQELTLK